MRKKRINFSLILFLLLIPSLLLNIFLFQKTEKLEENNLVTGVIDGDTFVLKSGQKVRLGNLDAPELEFCGGKEAKERLEKLILGKTVELDIFSYGEFNRPLALVYQKGTLVNEILLKEGLVRYDGDPSPQRERLKKAHDEAVENRKGIFGPPCLSLEPDKPGCLIKANIDRHSGKKIYHFPGCNEYQSVKVEKDLGENWFCSEEEAEKAGFSKALNCHGKSYND
ncbi:MAG: thermonuclease family protein [Patescibacteria group bacterium]